MKEKYFIEILTLKNKNQKIIGIIVLMFTSLLLAFAPGSNTFRDSTLSDNGQLIQNFPYGHYELSAAQYSKIKIDGNEFYSVIDIRSEKEFEESSIAEAENIPLTSIMPKMLVDYKDAKILFIDNDGQKASQLMVITRLLGYDAYVFKGGLNSLKAPSKTDGANSPGQINQLTQFTTTQKGKNTTKPKKKKKKKKRGGCD